MASTKDTYRVAAREHLERAQEMFNSGSYYLAHYLAGLAVECHLRAWLLLKTREFDARHDLELLARESGYITVVPSEEAVGLSSALATLNKRWRSNQRYYSERQLLDYLTEIKADFGSRGDRWKNLARAVLGCAHRIVKQGETQWNKE